MKSECFSTESEQTERNVFKDGVAFPKRCTLTIGKIKDSHNGNNHHSISLGSLLLVQWFSAMLVCVQIFCMILDVLF